MWWRELPNYNPIGASNSAKGKDHSGNAEALFADTNSDPEDQHNTPGNNKASLNFDNNYPGPSAEAEAEADDDIQMIMSGIDALVRPSQHIQHC